KERLRKIIPEKIDEYAIPVEQLNAIKRGSDFITPSGKVIPHEEMTEAPPRPRSYAFLTDTKVQDALIPKLQGVDMLYHDTTFTKDAEQRAAETCHATGEQAAAFAKQAGVGRLLLGHFSAKYRDLTPLLEEAQAVLPNSALATGGKTFQVPPETT
ncbi:MAG: ribonuclease Z, partial [Bacteroidetes bacterium SW_11_45_7]